MNLKTLNKELDWQEAAPRRETYLERELRHNRENNPAMWSYSELLRRIEERERELGGLPF
jgi:hypothetical protein